MSIWVIRLINSQPRVHSLLLSTVLALAKPSFDPTSPPLIVLSSWRWPAANSSSKFYRSPWWGPIGWYRGSCVWRYLRCSTALMHLTSLTISGLTVYWGTLTMFLQNGALKLRSSTKSIEAVFAKVSFWSWLQFVEGAVFATWICRVAPLIRSMAPIRCCCCRVVRLLVFMQWINPVVGAVTIQSRVGIISRAESATGVVVTRWRYNAIGMYVAPRGVHTVTIV